MSLLSSPTDLATITEHVTASLATLTGPLGYDAFAIEMFYDEFLELLTEVLPSAAKNDDPGLAKSTLHDALTGPSAEYYAWYMRLLTSCELKSNSDNYAPFLDDKYLDINDYCAKEVEPSGVECTQIQLIALANALSLQVTVIYLDGHDKNGEYTTHNFGEEAKSVAKVKMLYRPGHYDILE
jgi:ubiquitin thioesterase protein OTUB1